MANTKYLSCPPRGTSRFWILEESSTGFRRNDDASVGVLNPIENKLIELIDFGFTADGTLLTSPVLLHSSDNTRNCGSSMQGRSPSVR